MCSTRAVLKCRLSIRGDLNLELSELKPIFTMFIKKNPLLTVTIKSTVTFNSETSISVPLFWEGHPKEYCSTRELDAGQLLGTGADEFPISFPHNGKLWETELFLLWIESC